MAFLGKIKNVFSFLSGATKIDDELFEEIEELLIQADIGPRTAVKIIDNLKNTIKESKTKEVTSEVLKEKLKEELISLIADNPPFSIDSAIKPYTIVVVGVNGVGKTTTIAKLANMFKKQGKKVVLAAGDTFRAGAIEQLTHWAEVVGVRIVKSNPGSDSASVVYDAYQSAKSQGEDVLIVDTAGRLHNKDYLMEELKKIYRVLKKHGEELPHETFLVIDATTGRNGVEQAKVFNEAVKVTGIILTKLDGTAKGGTIFSIKEILDVPIRFITTGEKLDDIEYFDKEKFVEKLFEKDD